MCLVMTLAMATSCKKEAGEPAANAEATKSVEAKPAAEKMPAATDKMSATEVYLAKFHHDN